MSVPADDPHLVSDARTTREGGAIDRLLALQVVTTLLASALDEPTIAEIAVDHGMRAVGANTAAMWLTEGDHLRFVRSLGVKGAARQQHQRIPLDLDAPVAIAATQRRSQVVSGADEYARVFPASAARLAKIGGDLLGAIAAVPLTHGPSTRGVLLFEWGVTRTLDRDEVAYLELLAAHAVQALERARLFEAERAARARVELLYELAGAVTRAESLQAALEPALDAVCRALAVERASILLFDDAGVMRFRAWRGLSEEYRRAVDGHSPWTRDARAPEPILVSDVESDEALAAYRPVFAREGIRALGFVPLVHDTQLLGKFMVYGPAPRLFTEDDVRLATAVAGQIAQAVSRRHAEAEVRRAQAEAERAAAAREQLLAVVAHDLRNPLGVAQLKAQVMLRRLPHGADGEALRKDLDVIRRNTVLMGRLISDLLDVASIEVGALSIDRSAQPVVDLVAEAVELVRSLADEKNISLASRATFGDATVDCDRQRVLQIFGNLLGNAIKFTPPGGVVTVEAVQDGGEITFAVVDDGPGIPAEERERVFEQWARGDRRATGEKKKAGVGLGLFIARGLVTAHGGRIWIEAAEPRGTRVAFTMPGCRGGR